MCKVRTVVILLALLCGTAWCQDEFDGLKCGTDIAKALQGKRFVNQRVVAMEQRHKDLALQDLGGTEISNRLFLISWQICGSEFQLLLNTKTSRIRDVLPFPAHSKSSPEAIGGCQVDGHEIPEAVVAVLDNGAGYNPSDQPRAKTVLSAKAAWKIDEIHERFEPMSIKGLGCPLWAVITQDGGM